MTFIYKDLYNPGFFLALRCCTGCTTNSVSWAFQSCGQPVENSGLRLSLVLNAGNRAAGSPRNFVAVLARSDAKTAAYAS